MLHLSIFCTLLALAVAQNGYDYNKPGKTFVSSSNRPDSSGSTATTSTPYSLRPQSDDFAGPTTSNSARPQNYPGNQRPSFSYPGQGPRPSGPVGYPNGPSSTPGSGHYPGSHSEPGSYSNNGSPGGPGGYPGGTGHTDSNSLHNSRGPSETYPGQANSAYPQDLRRPSTNYPGQPPRYPESGNSLGQSGTNFANSGFGDNSGNYEGGDYSAIPGEPGRDYPILSYIPHTNFNCQNQQYPGYYADTEARCQVFHVCASNRTYDFLCPNGTVFSQEKFVCVWWNQFNCDSAPSLYDMNAKLYDYSMKSSSDFSGSNYHDYSGSKYPVEGRPQGSYSPGSRTSQPSGNYPNNFGSQHPTTSFPSVTLTNSLSSTQTGYSGQNGRYPGAQASSSGNPSGNGPHGTSARYPSSQGLSGNYVSTQGPHDTYPSYHGSYSSPHDQPGGHINASSGYPTSTTPYPGTDSGSQGYPSGRPSGPSFPESSGVRQPQQPNREYLPPRNKRARQSKHYKS